MALKLRAKHAARRARGETVTKYAERWIKARKLSVGTWSNEESHLEHHVLPVIGHLGMTEVAASHGDDIVARLDEETASSELRDKTAVNICPSTPAGRAISWDQANDPYRVNVSTAGSRRCGARLSERLALLAGTPTGWQLSPMLTSRAGNSSARTLTAPHRHPLMLLVAERFGSGEGEQCSQECRRLLLFRRVRMNPSRSNPRRLVWGPR
jgi:hypothetical protein